MPVAEYFAEGVGIVIGSRVEVACGSLVLSHVEEFAPVLVCLVASDGAFGHKDGRCTVHILEGLCLDGGRHKGIDIHLLHLLAACEAVVGNLLHGGG